jgi:hypothetical protein
MGTSKFRRSFSGPPNSRTAEQQARPKIVMTSMYVCIVGVEAPKISCDPHYDSAPGQGLVTICHKLVTILLNLLGPRSITEFLNLLGLEHPVKCGFYSIFCRLNKHFTECPWLCGFTVVCLRENHVYIRERSELTS